ncbi:hypothetical protein SDC9_157814 [bioreactor metagenome]|uniref:Uncharacterized protein n=1 Tax=bioreactor metagenome TaxID=1076179 RepID=A0A645FB10_9ZZZZ
MSHLAVSDLAVRQADIQPGGGELTARRFGKQPVQIRGTGVSDGVAGAVGAQSIAVHDN